MAYARIRPRRGTLYEWTTVDPVLYEGELGTEYPDTGVGTGLCKFKIGDGVTKYSKLPYAFDGAAAQSINGGTVSSGHLIQLRSGTTAEWKLADPVLGLAEITLDTTVNSLKIGNGTSKWSELEYINSADSITGIDDYGNEDA